jgi:hypothetical protein
MHHFVFLGVYTYMSKKKAMLSLAAIMLFAGTAGFTAYASNMEGTHGPRSGFSIKNLSKANKFSLGENVKRKRGKGKSQGVSGTVSAISGSIISVTAKDSSIYSVDATNVKTIMKSSASLGTPTIVIKVSDIAVGDTIMARGILTDKTLVARSIFDGQMPEMRRSKNHLK